MSKLISVNVGLPREIEWRGKRVRTAIWKHSVPHRVLARRLNLDGDGQADLQGHGGEQRAVMVYQFEAYGYWERQLGWTGFEYEQFLQTLHLTSCLVRKEGVIPAIPLLVEIASPGKNL
ncbi:hypothetical protein [Edaphobacter modestus]|uniref:MOSC domain-containing protein n=1 Tax=Edaphobacter modestus TaxID=388466 RepID=A0A4Q7YTA1_9BACT|nr:hypothetical protein [Edaphobacter modestus]RZU40808.1 hypothetical protein BDD14_2292 [Edaphobacter modestus]